MHILVLATRNAGKVQEISRLLDGLAINVLAASDVAGAPHVEEDAATLRGNALKKAMVLHTFTGYWALADDTGLMVSALNGAPGVYSARYAGAGCTPRDNRQKLLGTLAGVQDRAAAFCTAMALVTGEEVAFFDGVCRGHIATEERGRDGFGYDALFVPEGTTQTFAELSAAEKNVISHRGRAMRACRSFLEKRLGA